MHEMNRVFYDWMNNLEDWAWYIEVLLEVSEKYLNIK